MYPKSSILAVTGLLAASAAAAPSRTKAVEKRDIFNGLPDIASVLAGIEGDAATATEIFENVLKDLNAVVPTNSPADIGEVQALVQEIFAPQRSELYTSGEAFIANSLSPGDLSDVFATYSTGINSYTNYNPKNPKKSIYPKFGRNDAPYSLTEKQLREAIYIPPTFTWGKKPPVILVPGTGLTGGLSYGGNYIKLLTDVSYADPVWLNIPPLLLGDTQINSEYIAYATNYIFVTTSQRPSLIGWSQGTIDTQWALKYWPSTRSSARQLIALSPDYHGSLVVPLICPYFPALPCAPALVQQEYGAAFVARLRANGGDSAYIPTTNIFSATDEIVQPQAQPGASGALWDVRGVGVANVELQSVCNGEPAGLFYTHEGVLFNPVAVALAKDALVHGGPAEIGRIDLWTLCQEVVAQGLGLGDVVATEASVPLGLTASVAYPYKVYVEPPLMAYATY